MKRIRKNIMMLESVIAKAEELIVARNMGANKFSHLLADLVLDAHKRQASGGDKSPEQYLTEIVGLLADKRTLEATIKEKMERFKLERKGLTEALALCEEDLRKAKL
jgi:hypothetical protein